MFQPDRNVAVINIFEAIHHGHPPFLLIIQTASISCPGRGSGRCREEKTRTGSVAGFGRCSGPGRHGEKKRPGTGRGPGFRLASIVLGSVENMETTGPVEYLGFGR